jgi:ferrous iron transport protein B
MGAFGQMVGSWIGEGMLHSLIVDGIIAGVGSVLVFLPQILILFFFILLLEDVGYLPRAAFLLDRIMGSVGLSDRLVTIMIAPLMTCSARLPVYALLIAAFIPDRVVGGFMNLQGIVLFVLYLAGILSAMAVAWFMKRRNGYKQHALMLELPAYHWPHPRGLASGLLERAKIFLMRVGTLILAMMILLWLFSSFPGAPEGATHPPIYYSVAGMIGRALEVVLAPIGFNWQIAIALVPGMAAREVAVGALGTVYALSGGDEVGNTLAPLIAQSWSLATGLSLLAWYVYAPHCLPTLATVARETGSRKYAWIMAGYMFALAYVAAFIVYRVTLAFTGA